MQAHACYLLPGSLWGGCQAMQEAHVDLVQQQVLPHLDRQLLPCISPGMLAVLPYGQPALHLGGQSHDC